MSNNFNPRSLTGATQRYHAFTKSFSISIHAPLRERLICSVMVTPLNRFQSTLPYGSDFLIVKILVKSVNFNPRSLTGATSLHRDHLQLFFISIHAPLRERLSYRCSMPSSRVNFNPRSLTGATIRNTSLYSSHPISIHAPLRERHKANDWAIRCVHISIHAPLRERRMVTILLELLHSFQSTLPYGSDLRQVWSC